LELKLKYDEKDKIIETLKTENIVLKEKVEKVESVSSGKEKESIKELQGKVLQLQKKLEASGLENERKLLDKEKIQAGLKYLVSTNVIQL